MENHPEWSQKTFANEDLLPRVPLPTLRDSLERFMEWCAPLLTPDELAETQQAADDMLPSDSPAHKLHAALETYNQTPGVYSWLDTFWPSRYLGRRDRIALNANFFFLFKDTGQTQLERAAGLIAGAAKYNLSLDNETLSPVIMRGQALSMEQNKFLFSETRIPGVEQDTVRAEYPSSARHIAVLYHGNSFKMDIIAPDGKPYTATHLQAALAHIMDQGQERASDTAVGCLTTKARAEWAASRQRLLAENVDAFETIETALFCLCLDDISPKDTHAACDQLLHGDGGNRWFDKSVSLVVFGNGQAGINVEHCSLDGTTILNFVDSILADDSDTSTVDHQGEPDIAPIIFRLDDAQRADIRAAADAFADYAAHTATETISFDIGSDDIKRLGISPDAFAQMAYQLAHYRTKGMIGATYEAIATRQYQHGRTEAMRVVTPEIVTFVSIMNDVSADREAKQAALRTAAAKHVERSKQCQSGQAPEQHLWELQLIQKRQGKRLGAAGPMALYDSPGWRIMRDDYLSTSSAPSPNVQFFGFGSTSLHCIGIGYVLLPDQWNVYLSTPQQVADDMHTFADNLRAGVEELLGLLS